MADPNKIRSVPTFNPRPATAQAMAPAEPKMITVKAAVDTITAPNGETYESPRVVYDMADVPIPHDAFVTTPMTASLVLAIMSGDVIQADEGNIDGGEGTPALSKLALPAEFGGRPTEEQAQAQIERRERAEQARTQEPQSSGGL
jgi:hypothetical protein